MHEMMHIIMHAAQAAAPPFSPSLSFLKAYSANDLRILIKVIKNAPNASDPMFVIEAHLIPRIISPDPSFSALEEK